MEKQSCIFPTKFLLGKIKTKISLGNTGGGGGGGGTFGPCSNRAPKFEFKLGLILPPSQIRAPKFEFEFGFIWPPSQMLAPKFDFESPALLLLSGRPHLATVDHNLFTCGRKEGSKSSKGSCESRPGRGAGRFFTQTQKPTRPVPRSRAWRCLTLIVIFATSKIEAQAQKTQCLSVCVDFAVGVVWFGARACCLPLYIPKTKPKAQNLLPIRHDSREESESEMWDSAC